MAYLEDIPKYAFGTAYELASFDEAGQDGGKQNGKISESQLRDLIRGAIKLGCRHFDCAPLYKTQHIVGQVLKEVTSSSSHQLASRQELFITSKLPVNMMRPENIDKSIRMILEELQLTYLDLFLIHAPFSTQNTGDDQNIYPLDPETGQLLLDEQENLLESAWTKLADLKRRGLVRYIGLSNVNLDQLSRLNSMHHVDVVQNEYHIYNQDRTIFDYCEELDVHFEAYAAFGSPLRAKELGLPSSLTDPIVQRVARENNLTVAQVNIQWIHQQPLSYVIKCDNYQQLEENLASIQGVRVPMNDMIELDSLNRNVRIYYFDQHKGIKRHREYPFRENQQLANQKHQHHQHHQHHQQQPPVATTTTAIAAPATILRPFQLKTTNTNTTAATLTTNSSSQADMATSWATGGGGGGGGGATTQSLTSLSLSQYQRKFSS